VAGVSYHYHSHKGRRFWDNLLLNTWLVGLFIRNGVYSRFCRMLGMMLKSGVNILPALDLVSQIVSNSIFEDSINRMKEEVGQGNTISQQMRQEGLFPTLIVQMVSVGETSGKVDEMLSQASDHYDAEMDRLTKNLESMIEPFFIMVLAIFVGVLALGIFLPMWDLYALIGTQS